MTNPLHYPDLDRCRKLTEIGFPVCTLAWCDMTNRENSPSDDIKITDVGRYTPRRQKWTIAQCPSVMEMLDVIPTADISKDENGCSVWVTECDNGNPNDKKYFEREFEGTLPNALADLILWLHENKYITFNK